MTTEVVSQQSKARKFTAPRIVRLEQPSLLISLLCHLRDALFPEKFPPLRVSSRPVPVRDIWEKRNAKRSTTLSLLVHGIFFALVIAASMYKPKTVQVAKPTEKFVLVTPNDLLMPMTPEAGPAMHGGGGGGVQAKLEAPKGKLPKQDMLQLTPPKLEVEQPKLPVEASVQVPKNIKLMNNTMPTIGDPLTKIQGPASSGIGSGGGIGSGKGTGIGIGTGGGVGPGSGGGYGGGAMSIGGGVQAPRPISTPEPEFSEEARRMKHQGIVVLWLIVGPDGHTHDIRVKRGLGMGLDEKAIEAVKNWRFEPALKDGRPVAVYFNVEVNFTLH